MKTLLISLLSLCLISSYAQNVGLTTSTTVRKTNIRFNNGASAETGFTLGFCYDQPIYKRLGLSTGLLYAELINKDTRLMIPFDFSNRPSYYHWNFTHVLEVPVDLNLRVSKPAAGWPLFFSAGYRLNMVLGKQTKNFFKQYHEWLPLKRNKGARDIIRHSGVVGIELRHQFPQQFILAFGSTLAYTWVPGDYGFSDWRVFVKFSYHVKRDKTKKAG